MHKIARMDELDLLIIRAQAGDLDAFGTLVQRFQDMAVGYAYSILGDFQRTRDSLIKCSYSTQRRQEIWTK